MTAVESDETDKMQSNDNRVLQGQQTALDESATVNRHVEKPATKDESAEESSPQMDIDPEDEIIGIRLYVIHSTICLCTFLIGLDANLLATAVPVITTRFHSLRDIGWYGSAFSIALCACQPLAGKTYLLFPKKWVYIIYLFLFEIGNLVCALAPSSNALIVGRAVAGAGASGVFAGGFVILITIVPLAKRPIFMGTIASTFAIASIVGPVISGALTQHLTWRWCFYINLPFGGFAAAVTSIVFNVRAAVTEKVSLKEKLKGLDGIGFVLFAGAVVMLLLALMFGGSQYAWNSSTIVGLFVGFGVTLPVFVLWTIRLQEMAMIPPRIFKNRNAVFLFFASIFMNGPFQVIVFWLPIWFQAVLGVQPEGSGTRFLPTVISDALTGIIGPAIVQQLGVWNPFLLLGYALISIGAGLLTTIHPGITEARWIGYQILGGVGYALCSSLNHIGMQASLSQDLVPLGATLLLFAVSMSAAIFLAIGQAVFNDRLSTNLRRSVPDSVADRVISAGATSVRSVVSAENLPVVLQAYSKSVTQVFYIAAAAPVLAFLMVLMAKWIRLKQKEATKEDVERQSSASQGAKGQSL